MEMTTLFTVLLVVALLVGLTYLAFFKKIEDVPPPVEEVIPDTPSKKAPRERRPRMTPEQRAQRRARLRAEAAAAAGTDIAAEGATAIENVAGEILNVDITPKPAPAPLPAGPREFASDANPSAADIAAAPSADTTPFTPTDDLTRIKGLGPRAAATLNAMGVTRFSDIASWSNEDAAEIDGRMGAFQGRIARDRWVEQATYLANGDLAGFEAKFGSLG